MFVLESRLFQRLMFVVVLGLSSAARSQAGVIQLLTPADLSPDAHGAAFPEPEGTLLPTPYTLATPDNVFTYSLNPGGEFLRGNIGAVTFLYTGGLITGVFSPVTISAAVPLREIMVGLLSNVTGSTTFSFTAFNANTALGTFTVGGPYGTSLFAGVRATGTDVITRLTIGSPTNDFVLCNCGYGDAPEPTVFSLSLLGIGLIGFAVSRRNASIRRTI